MTATVLADPSRLRFAVRVQPRSSRSRLVGVHGDALKIQVTAPPVEGAANDEVVAVLAKELRVARAAVHLVAGLQARNKVVEVECADPEGLRQRLLDWASVDKTKAAD